MIKKIFLDHVGFNTSFARFFNLSVILGFLAVYPTSLLGNLPFKCVFKNFLLPLIFRGNCPTTGLFAGCECPACGLTRGMSRLLHGDLAGAWAYNKLVFIVFAVMVILIVYNLVLFIKEYKKTGKIY